MPSRNNIKGLAPEKVMRRCVPATLGFKTTVGQRATKLPLGQAGAMKALQFGTEIDHFGYNIFVFGPSGTGKHGIVMDKLKACAETAPAPDDWCYVNNFADPQKPSALRFPAGGAKAFAADMDRVIDDLRVSLPAAFQTEEYRQRREALENEFRLRHDEAFGQIQKKAESIGATMIRTPEGTAIAPIEDGQVVSPEVFNSWPPERKEKLRQDISALELELEGIARNFPVWRRELVERIREINRAVTELAVNFIFEEILNKYLENSAVTSWLSNAINDVKRQVENLMTHDSEQSVAGKERRNEEIWVGYKVNVIVDNSKLKCAPVVFADHPTHPALFGRIEHQARNGTLSTDYRLIRPGLLHQANGGYLVIDAQKAVSNGAVWEELKRVIRSRLIRIEGLYEALGLSTTTTLTPEEIPVDVKIVLIGDARIQYLLRQYDPDIDELFKVSAEFEDSIERTAGTERQYASLIADSVNKFGLCTFDATAVARVVEQASRQANDSKKLSLRLRQINDLLREADHLASSSKDKIVTAKHIDEVVAAGIERQDRIRRRSYEQIGRGIVMVDVRGKAVGQVNGLSVLQVGGFAFGRPSRITARVRMGRGEIIDIERQVELGGPLHSKGVFILSGYLGEKFARRSPLALSASLVFEQSYGGVDGDSASSAELYALLSALSGVPVGQNFAVTGSVNQMGEVQAIGGVNEKIEGFFDICRERGLTGNQGVLIPKSNVTHLMLRQDVVDAVRKGKFNVYPVSTIDQGIEILTGVPGGRLAKNGRFPKDSINGLVAAQLLDFAHTARKMMPGAAQDQGR